MIPGLVNKFNRGEIAAEALGRLDVDKVNNCCSYMNNFMPIRLGPMTFRPGFEHVDSLHGQAKMFPFVAATDDVALLEFVNNALYVWVDDAPIAATTVTTSITNGTFATDIAGWTDASGTGSTTSWDSTLQAAKLTGSGTTSAVLYQTFGTTDTGTEHTIRLVIVDAPLTLKLGTSGSGSSDLFEGELSPGTHSLVFTPGGDVTMTISNAKQYSAKLSSVAFSTTGTVSLPTSVATADLSMLRVSQSADVVFVACGTTIQQFKIERRGIKSWSIVDYRADDGPFGTVNNTQVSMTAGALYGDTTLTASEAFFTADHVGSLYKLVSAGQTVVANVSADNNGTGSIRVTGVGSSRSFSIIRTGTWVATVTLQRSADDATWEDVASYTANGTISYNDSLDNSVLYYRLWVKTGDYTSGTVELSLVYSAGSIEGIARVIGYTSSTVVNVQVLQAFGSTDATRDWYQGEWSAVKGYPSSVALYDGRLWWAGKNKVWGSVSDAFTSFDTGIEGDSASIRRTIGFGPVDSVYWLAPVSRLLMGLAGAEISVRSSSLGEILTPTNTNLKGDSSQGSANLPAEVVDQTVYFAQRSKQKIYALEYSAANDSHGGTDLTTLHPSICVAGVAGVVSTRQPESRLFVTMDDGTARVYLFDPSENVAGWSRISAAAGTIEDFVVLPSLGEDRVYASINRSGTRYLCKMAKFSECQAGTTDKSLDFSKTYTSPGTTITVAGSIAVGESVYVWADGGRYGPYTVDASNQITVPTAWTNVTVGMKYTADYTSNKLGDYVKSAEAAYVINKKKRVVDTGVILRNYLPGVLTIGASTSALKALPLIKGGTDIGTAPLQDYDEIPFEFNGNTETDPRIYMRADGPCTIMALTYDIKPARTPSTKG